MHSRTQLFIYHFPSSYTSPVHLSGMPHKPVSLHSLARSAASWTTFPRFLMPEFFFFFFFTNNTKLVGISFLCVPHRNILEKIIGTSFKWGEKVGQGESWEAMRVCVCVYVYCTPHLLDTLYCQKAIVVRKEVEWRNQRDARCQW